MRGDLANVFRQDLSGRMVGLSCAVALDSEQNKIQRKDIVDVTLGPRFGIKGAEILHLYRHFVFLHSRTVVENGGIIACLSRHLVRADCTSKNTSSSGSSASSGSPKVASSSHHVSGGSGDDGRRNKVAGKSGKYVTLNRDLIGKEVKITQGLLSDRIGVVKVI